MSNPTTPQGMLKVFRQQSAMFDNEQAALFNKMPLKEKLELLFYMSLHNNMIVRALHEKMDPNLAPVQGMPESEKVQ